MTQKEIAEAYVRSKLPELHSNYCGVHNELKIPSAEWCTCDIPQLQHWLRVIVDDKNPLINMEPTSTELMVAVDMDSCYVNLRFNLTTGQPATEADYQAFNEICKV